MISSSSLCIIILAGAAATACGGKTDDGRSGANDVGTPVDSATDTGATDTAEDAPSDIAVDTKPAVCNALDNRAPVVQPENRAEAPPAPRGGVVSDGTYEATSSTTYTGPGGLAGPRGETVQTTLVLAGSVVQVVQKLGDAKATHGSGAIKFMGLAPSMTYNCPADFVAPWDGYDADAMSLSLHNTKIGLVVRLKKR